MPLWLMGVLAVGSTVVPSLLGLWLTRRYISAESLREHHDVAGFILAIVGVIYAVLLGFVVIAVWEDYEEAKVMAEQEANAVLDVYRMAPGLPDGVKYKVRRDVKVYAKSVVSEEWPSMAAGRTNDKTSRALDQIWRTLTAVTLPGGGRTSIIYDQTLSRLTAISDNRRLRLLASHSGLPGPLWVVIGFGGLTTMIFTYFFGLEKFAYQAAMTALLAATIGLVIFVIGALDYPFSGDMRVTPEAMQSVIERFDDLEIHERTGA